MISDASSLSIALEEALALPRREQPDALRRLSESIEAGELEEWNSHFGPASLFDAWTGNQLVSGLYRANARTLQQYLGDGWSAIEVGGGDGRLWAHLSEVPAGDLWVVDPSPGVHERLRSLLPSQIRLHSMIARVQDALPDLPEVDAVICSLTLHHIAGADTHQRQASGLAGPGKLEILQIFREKISASRGLLLINEADIHCDLELASGSPLLMDRLIDSYVRRTARALCNEMASLEQNGDPDQRRSRILALIKHWCLDQIDMALKPVAERDVYELDVARWLGLFKRAGLTVREHQFTDEWLLFHRYVLTPAD
jgi:hypothetical protein